MPPKLDPLKVGRIDGDMNRVRDYDQRVKVDDKKYTYFYTKQELELQKAHERAQRQIDRQHEPAMLLTLTHHNAKTTVSTNEQTVVQSTLHISTHTALDPSENRSSYHESRK
jgi:hypothetical protein